jgi:LCP family protein required for cell wall assembly
VFSSHLARVIAGKAGYAAACLCASVLLVVAGYAHKEVAAVVQVGKGVQISNSPSVGALNILVMGLESRTDYQGDDLDHHLRVVLHSGTNGHAQDTNTLILIHIFAGGQRAVGFSIPRDSVVKFPQTYYGESGGKIDAAYDWAYYQYLGEHAAENKSDRYLHANQAGQLATVNTVESVTGVHIDHFIEVNLVGFYYLAQAFGGIEACVKPAPASLEPDGFPAGTNLTDHDPLTGTFNSGFDAKKDGYSKSKGGAQYLHLSPAQSLAFVRSRDTLPGIDVGRTYRQQAAIDYVVWKLKNEGLLSSVTQANSLLSTANKYLITDQGFQLLDFATQMHALSGDHLSLSTLPGTPVNNVPLPGYPQPQDIIRIDVPQIQHLVQSAFAGKPTEKAKGKKGAKATASVPAPSTITVDVYNGNPAAQGLAAQMSQAIVALGYKAGAIKNSSAQTRAVQPGTQVFYGKDAAANAANIAAQFGTSPVALPSLPAHHVEILIGSTVTAVPAGLLPSSTSSASTQAVAARVIGAKTAAYDAAAAASPTPSTSPSAPAGEGTTVAPNAKYGIPCVY